LQTAESDEIMKNGDGTDELDIETRKYVLPSFRSEANCVSRQIGQLFLIGFQGLTLSPEIRHLIEHYYIGNIIFARRNIVGMTMAIYALANDRLCTNS
jgi:hypothetical protein